MSPASSCLVTTPTATPATALLMATPTITRQISHTRKARFNIAFLEPVFIFDKIMQLMILDILTSISNI